MPNSSTRKPKVHKIALTGGPGGGKTTAAELFRREYKDHISLVPESATLLFKGGYPRVDVTSVLENIQSSIYYLQQNLESSYATLYPHHTLLCDRGTVDGGAYWPSGPEDFFKQMNSGLEQELARYDGVIFFETAAAGGLDLDLQNPIRIEDQRKSIELDLRLKELWSRHPRFTYVRNQNSFLHKIQDGIKAMDEIIKVIKQGQA
jgi:hypothetical protein